MRAIMISGISAFAGGALLVGYLVQSGQLQLGNPPSEQGQSAPSAGKSAESSAPRPTVAVSELDQQVAILEQRLARLNLQAAAFDGNSARAEALLIAQAARRTIEQGRSLGYLEGQLRARFGAARPEAVKTITDAARSPVTLDSLAAQLDDLEPALMGQPRNETGWQRFRREMGGLFVVRRESGQVRRPASRFDHARLLLRSGQIEDALREVGLMPGAAAAKGWTAQVQRYQAAQAALAQIEEAALTEPERLRDGNGEAIRQPGLSADPVAEVPQP